MDEWVDSASKYSPLKDDKNKTPNSVTQSFYKAKGTFPNIIF